MVAGSFRGGDDAGSGAAVFGEAGARRRREWVGVLAADLVRPMS